MPGGLVMTSRKFDFIIATNAQEDISCETVLSVQNLWLLGYRFLWVMLGVGGASRTKNVLLTQFYNQQWGECEKLILLDRDIAFNPEQLGNIVCDLDEYGLVGGCYTVRDGKFLSSHGFDGVVTMNNEIQAVEWLAFGFTGITLSFLKNMKEKLDLPLLHIEEDWAFYPWGEQYRYQHPDGQWMWLSEDYDFCRKAREIGEHAYLDTRVWVGHIGSRMQVVQDAIAEMQRREAENGSHSEVS